jgi:hypothetical protein
MDRSVRRRLRVLAWFTFVVLVPLVISSARGYRVTSLSRRSLGPPAIGALVIRTVPRGATAALDGRIVDQQTPTGIGSVPAGTHRVRIEKSGYRPYEKQVEVVGGQVTDLLHVRLLPLVIPERTLESGVTDFWISPDERWILLQEGTRLRLIALRAFTEQSMSTSTERSTDGRFLVSIRPSDALNVLWSPDGSSAALVRRGDKGKDEVLGLLNTDGGSFERLPRALRPVGWTTLGRSKFLALSGDQTLFGFLSPHPEAIAEGVLAAAVHPDGVLIQQRTAETIVIGVLNDALVFTPLDNQEATPFSQLAVSRHKNIAALSADDNTLFILPFSQSSSWQRFGRDVEHLMWSPDGDTLAYQESAFDLWTLNVSEERSTLPHGVPTLVARLSSPVAHVQWFPDSQHLLFLSRDVVEFIETDPRDRRPADHLTSTNRGATQLAVRSGGEEIWLTARRDEQDALLQIRLTADE